MDGRQSSDPDGDAITYEWRWVTLPEQSTATLNSTTVPNPQFTADRLGLYLIDLFVHDGQLSSVADTVRIDVVEPPNQPPVITSLPTTTANANAAYQYNVEANDPDGDALTFLLAVSPSGLSIDAATGVISWLPTIAQQGSHAVTVVVEDGRGGSDSQQFIVDVRGPLNIPPNITSTAITTGQEGQLYSYDVDAVDAESQALTYTLTAAPNTMTIDALSGVISWTPGFEQAGSYAVTVVVSDGEFTDTQSFVIDVANTNREPRIQSTPVLTGAENIPYQYTVTAEDLDGDTLSYTLTTAPPGMAISLTGSITWTPDFDQAGDYTVVVEVSDGQLSDVQTFVVMVANTNRAPVITSSAAVSGVVNAEYRYQLIASDPDGDSLIFQLLTAPAGMNIDTSGLVIWTPTEVQQGTNEVRLLVEDGLGGSASQNFTVNVDPALNNAPEIISTAVTTVQEGELYQYDVDAVDPDSSELTYSLEKAPAGMAIDPVTGVISWVPDSALVGSVLTENTQCKIPGRNVTSTDKAADFLVVIDVSRSMVNEVAWISGAIANIDAELLRLGIGRGTPKNRYGLVLFGTRVGSADVGGNLFGPIDDFVRATFDLKADNQFGFEEDGLQAVQFAFDNYVLREDAAKNIVLLSDEGRTSQNPDITVDTIIAGLRDRDIVLNSVFGFESGAGLFKGVICDNDTFGFGLDGLQRGYKVEENGFYSICENARFQDTLRITQYYPPAFQSGGASWDLHYLGSGGDLAKSFSKAFINVKVDEIINNLPSREQIDLVIKDIEFSKTLGKTVVSVLNRGLIPSDLSVLSVRGDGGLLLAESQVNALDVGEMIEVAFDIDLSLFNVIQAQISLGELVGDVTECNSDNNGLITPVVTVRVTDTDNHFDTQTFIIDVSDKNIAPVITSIPATSPVAVGQQYTHQIVVDDPDVGDSHYYRLLKPISNGTLDEFTGEFKITPELTDVGQHEMTFVVSDLAGNETRQTFTLSIEDIAGVSYILPHFEEVEVLQRAVIGDVYTFSPTVVLDQNAVLSFSLLTGPAGMSINTVTGELTWLESIGTFGHIESVALLLEDQFGNTDTLTFEVFIDKSNVSPQFTTEIPFDDRATFNSSGASYGKFVRFTDENLRESFTLEFDVAPQGMTISFESPVGTGLLSRPGKFTPTFANLEWDREDIDAVTTYPEHIRNFDYLCRAGGSSPMPTPVSLLWEFGSDVVHIRAAAIRDTNGDNVIDSDDLPTILATTRSNNFYGLDGDTQELLWTETRYGISRFYAPAVADINSDGMPEILLVENDLHVIAIRADDRSLLWRSDAPVRNFGQNHEDLYVADLNQDGQPEIIAGVSVFDADGQQLWQFPHTNPTRHGVPLVVDIDLDGVQEVVFGGQIRDALGNLINTIDYPDAGDRELNHSFTAPVNIDSDEEPELLLVDKFWRVSLRAPQRTVSLVDNDGSFIWGPIVLPGGMGHPVVGDITGDGETDVYIPGSRLLLSAATGEQQWQNPPSPNSDNETAVAIDFNEDGILEIVSPHARRLHFYHGQSGAWVKDLTVHADTLDYSMPVIANVNNDNSPEVIVVDQGVAVYQAQLPKVVPSNYPQSMLATTFITADLTVTPNPSPSWLSHNTFNVIAPSNNTFSGGLPDLRVSAPTGNFEQTLSVEVYNRGTEDYNAPFDVQVYAGDPKSSGILLGSQSVQSLDSNRSVTLSFDDIVPAGYGGELVAHIQPTVAVEECQIDNNDASSWPVKYTLTDHGGLTDIQAYALAVAYDTGFAYLFNPVRRAKERELFQYTPEVRNTDGHNSILFDILSAPEGVSVDPTSGLVSWVPERGLAGSHNILLSARSLTGNSQQISITVSVDPAAPNNTPEIISAAPTEALVGQSYSYDVDATDADNDDLVYSLSLSLAGMTIDAETGLINWTPSLSQLGTQSYRVQVDDGQGGVVEQSVVVTVVESANNPPSITSLPPGGSVTVGQSYIYDVNATDPDNDALQFSLNTAPDAMTIDPVTGVINWVPSASQQGLHPVSVLVGDGRGLFAFQEFTLNVVVQAPNNPPIQIPDANLVVKLTVPS